MSALAGGDYEYLKMGMEDRLHQNYRKKLVPGFNAVLKNGYRAGALGIALSGAGPSVFAFASRSKAVGVGREMEKGFLKSGKKAKSAVLEFNKKGAVVTT